MCFHGSTCFTDTKNQKKLFRIDKAIEEVFFPMKPVKHVESANNFATQFFAFQLNLRNCVSEIPSRPFPGTLKSVVLDYNNVTEFPASFCDCIMLDKLSMAHNNLDSIPEQIRGKSTQSQRALSLDNKSVV